MKSQEPGRENPDGLARALSRSRQSRAGARPCSPPKRRGTPYPAHHRSLYDRSSAGDARDACHCGRSSAAAAPVAFSRTGRRSAYTRQARLRRTPRLVGITVTGVCHRRQLTRGLVVHEVFQGRDPATVLRRYGMDSGKADEYRELYERFLASPLMQDALQDHREVPFLVRVNGFAFQGTIDRLVQRPGGAWLLIDYKTGKPGDLEDYAIQMTIYRRAARRRFSGRRCTLPLLRRSRRWVEVTVDEIGSCRDRPCSQRMRRKRRAG